MLPLVRKASPRDLFGKPISQRRLRYEAALERDDRTSLAERAARVRWVAQAIPRKELTVMPFETMAVLQEAKATFIAGQFMATIVLSAAFFEHWLASSLISAGFKGEAAQGWTATIACARQHSLVPPVFLDKADRLHQIGNPFIHHKSFEHEPIPVRRPFAIGKRPYKFLERDAQESLMLIYAVALYGTKRT